MKAQRKLSDKTVMESEELFPRYLELRPEFPNKEAARAHYLREMELIAKRYNSSIENLVSFIDKKNLWSDDDRYFMRLSRLVSALR